jgi:tRNA-2-methylthio-N6-dimethylallyladenosine synthase
VRFLSSHPKDLSERAIAVMAANPCFCRCLHLCVQHGSNRVLAAMNRRYTRERYLELVGQLREAMPDIALSTDILVGFPGETEEDVYALLSLMDEVKFAYAFMYHYNPREGTAAYRLPGRIPDAVKKERLARVIAKQSAHTVELLRAKIGARETVLVEGPSKLNADELGCRTEAGQSAVCLPPEGASRPISDWQGRFVKVEFSGLKGNTLRATIMGEEE